MAGAPQLQQWDDIIVDQTRGSGVHDVAGKKEDSMKIHSPLGTKSWWAYAKLGRRHRGPTGGGYTVQVPTRTLTVAVEQPEDIGRVGQKQQSNEVAGIRPHTDTSAEKMDAGSVDDDDVVERTGLASSGRSPFDFVPMRRRDRTDAVDLQLTLHIRRRTKRTVHSSPCCHFPEFHIHKGAYPPSP